MNKIILVGRLTKDVDFRTTKENMMVAKGSIAVNRPFKKNGETIADFFNIVAFKNTAELFYRFTHKGSRVLIEGSIYNNQYTDITGHLRDAFEVNVDRIELLDSKEIEKPKEEKEEESSSGNLEKVDVIDDDLPF